MPLRLKGDEGFCERYLQGRPEGYTGGYRNPEGSLSQEAVEEFAKKMKMMAEMFLGLFCADFGGKIAWSFLNVSEVW